MPQLQRSVATLRVSGDDLAPDEISTLLGSQPSHAQRKDQEFLSKSPSGVRVAKFGLWRLEAADTEPEDLNAQVSELLGRLTQNLEVWRELSRRFEVDLFCGWFMGGGNEGVAISPQTLLSLGERNVELSLDIFGPDTDA